MRRLLIILALVVSANTYSWAADTYNASVESESCSTTDSDSRTTLTSMSVG